MLGVTPQTLRKWEKTGELLPERRSQTGTRYDDVNKLAGINKTGQPTVCYARVSSYDQKEELNRQQELLEAYCAAKGWRCEVIRDLGAGMNSRQRGLNRLLELMMTPQMKRLVLTHKDRLLRFGAELVFTLCELQGIEVVIIHQGEQPSFEEELAQDVLELIPVFSARLYGSRSHTHQQIMDALKDAIDPQDTTGSH